MDLGAKHKLVEAARAATAQAFLTKAGGTRYGAAVRTVGGRVFTSGQYSSQNHSTNIHAEMAALLLATMAGEPDVVALAVADTKTESTETQVRFTRPCGVCRQVMQEHRERTGRDFAVLMAAPGGQYEEKAVSELLPYFWSATTQPSKSAAGFVLDDRRFGVIDEYGACSSGCMRSGDHVVCRDGVVAMVWDPVLCPDVVLGKIKYAAPDAEGGRQKVAHAFTQPHDYEAELDRIGWARPAPFGGVAAVFRSEDVCRRFPVIPATEVDDKELPVVLRLLEDLGIAPEAVGVTGSRAIKLSKTSSDWDLVVRATGPEATRLRAGLTDRLRSGALQIPDRSGTWKSLREMFPKGQKAILDQGRFAETFVVEGRQVAVMVTTPNEKVPCIDEGWRPAGRGQVVGTVTDANGALFKRASFSLTLADGSIIDVISYHKTANLVKEGDRLAVRGWAMTDGRRTRLIQASSWRDNIVWLPT